jgi:hypothetical protein
MFKVTVDSVKTFIAMPERHTPSTYNPDDPNYKENLVYENDRGKLIYDDTKPGSQSPASDDDESREKAKSLEGNYGQTQNAHEASKNSHERESMGESSSNTKSGEKAKSLDGEYGQSQDSHEALKNSHERDFIDRSKY